MFATDKLFDCFCMIAFFYYSVSHGSLLMYNDDTLLQWLYDN